MSSRPCRARSISALEGGDLALQARLPRDLAGGGEGQAREEAASRDVGDLPLQRLDDGPGGPAAGSEQRSRREERHLGGDFHEDAEVQVEAPVDVADQAGAAGDAAAERGERLVEALVGEGARDRPGQRCGRSGQRLADVGAGPYRVGGAALGVAAAGDGSHLEQPES